MDRLLLALVLVAVAVAVAVVVQRRKPAPPTGSRWNVPVQLDRADFVRPDAPWLVAVFTSATCETCGGVWEKAVPLDAGPEGPVELSQLSTLVAAAAELARPAFQVYVPAEVRPELQALMRDLGEAEGQRG